MSPELVNSTAMGNVKVIVQYKQSITSDLLMDIPLVGGSGIADLQRFECGSGFDAGLEHSSAVEPAGGILRDPGSAGEADARLFGCCSECS